MGAAAAAIGAGLAGVGCRPRLGRRRSAAVAGDPATPAGGHGGRRQQTFWQTSADICKFPYVSWQTLIFNGKS